MKTIKWLAMPLLALSLTGLTTACSDKNDEEDQGGAPAGTLTPEESKERLSQIGKDFVNAIPKSDFDELDQLATYIKDNYCQQDAQVEDAEKWADDCFKALVTSTWQDAQSYATKNYTRRVYQLSQFRAHLEYREGKWNVQKNTSDLQATCMDQNGQLVVAKLTPSGNTKKVFIGEIEMDKDYYQYPTIYKIDEAYAYIPENITITLTRGNQALVNITITTDLSSITGENFDLSANAASVSVRAQLAGYDIQCNRIAAKANTESGAVVNFLINKNGRKLLSAEVTATVSLPSGMVWSEYTDQDLFEDKLEQFGGKVTVCKLDVLGQLQVTAACTDAHTIYEQFETADDNKKNADVVNSCAQKINNNFTAQFFYDGGSISQGHMEIEATPNSEGKKYYLEPVIVFPDGSRYNMTNESYFNENNFRSLVDLFNTLCDNYEKMVENYDD